jgi:NDP-sugar pyrophosphorylase family protein
MIAVLLAGGPGTRLRPLTFAIPKPLVPVGEKPILEVLLGHLKAHGCTDAYLAVGYKGFLLRTYFGDGDALGLRIRYLEEETPLGTAGPVRAARDRFGLDETLFVSNADLITNADITAMGRFHREEGAALTVATRTYRERLIFGEVQHDGAVVQRVTEKPELSFDVSAGMYFVEPQVLDLVPEGARCDMPELINWAVEAGRRVLCFPVDGYWIGVESLAELESAREFVLANLESSAGDR